MQARFAFCGQDEIAGWHRALRPLLARIDPIPQRTPVGQLVKSMISGRTRDAVSLAAYDRLVGAYRTPARVAAAEVEEIAHLIAGVTFPEDKARNVVAALRRIAGERRSFDLDFLGALPVAQALAWLERLPGVARKVAASTLNASTLARPVMIVDSHVLRVLQRLGLVSPHAEAWRASEAVTAAMDEWNGADFLAFHCELKLLGQHVCRYEVPECGLCPLAGDCAGRLTD